MDQLTKHDHLSSTQQRQFSDCQHASVNQTSVSSSDEELAGVCPNRVALGDCSPRAPTDPYVRALAHTVPQITALLREEAVNAEHEPE